MKPFLFLCPSLDSGKACEFSPMFIEGKYLCRLYGKGPKCKKGEKEMKVHTLPISIICGDKIERQLHLSIDISNGSQIHSIHSRIFKALFSNSNWENINKEDSKKYKRMTIEEFKYIIGIDKYAYEEAEKSLYSSAYAGMRAGSIYNHKVGKVYFITTDNRDMVKIGFSDNANGRLHALQACSPLKLHIEYFFKGSRAMEKYLHLKFMKYHSHGEWFIFDEEISNAIKLIKEVLD